MKMNFKRTVAAVMALAMFAGPALVPTAHAEQTNSEAVVSMAEAYQAVPKRIFPTSPNAWVGDVIPMTDGDTVRLYYLYDTDHNGPLYHPIHQFTTQNFYEYEDLGVAIKCGPNMDAPDSALGTGSVLKDKDGLYHCFYTGHNDTFPSKGKDKECVMHAVSEDGVKFTKIPEDTFYAPDNYSSDDFRDPFVFWNEEENCYWLLIAARDKKLGGIVARYTSDDLTTWTLIDPLFAPGKQYMLECPDLFKMGDKYYLFYSWDSVTYYAMADSINGPFTQAADPMLASTHFTYYAAKTAELNGTRYLCGWVGRKFEPKDSTTYSWAGTMMNHELVQKPDGTLGIREPHQFAEFFTEEKNIHVLDQTDDVEILENGYRLTSGDKKTVSLVNFGQREPIFALECNVSFTNEGFAGFCFGKDQKYGTYTGMVIDAKYDSLHYEGSVLSRMAYVDPLIKTDYPIEPGRQYHVKLIMENEIATLYIDDAKVLCVRVYKAIDGGDFGLYAVNTGVEFTDISLLVP